MTSEVNVPQRKELVTADFAYVAELKSSVFLEPYVSFKKSTTKNLLLMLMNILEDTVCYSIILQCCSQIEKLE